MKHLTNLLKSLRASFTMIKIWLIVIAIVLSACQEDVITPGPSPDQDRQISEETTVVTDETNLGLISMDEHSIVFRKGLDQIDALEVGDIVVSAPSELAPYGYLRRITEISFEGSNIKLSTEQALLSDVIINGEFDLEQQLRPSDLQDANAREEGTTFSVTVNQILYDRDGNTKTTHDQLKLTGNVKVEPTFLMSAKFSWGKIKYFKAGLKYVNTNSLTLRAGGKIIGFNKEKEIFRKALSPVTIWAAGVPIVVVPYIIVKVGANGSIYAYATASTTVTSTGEGGVIYENSRWRDYKTKSVSGRKNSLVVKGGVSAEAFGKAAVEFKFYNLNAFKSSIYVKPAVKFGASCGTSSCNWSLNANAKAVADINVKIASAKIYWDKTLYSTSYPPFASGTYRW